MNTAIISAELKAILHKYDATCECGRVNECEVCNKLSFFNRLKQEISDYANRVTDYGKINKHYGSK